MTERMYKSAATTVLILAGLLVAGCSRLALHSQKSYITIGADPNRDSQQAQADCERAAKFFDTGKLEKAKAALEDALIADVSYAPAHNNLGRIHFEQGNLYLAAWEFEYARRLMPESAEVTNNLGMVCEAADQLQRAAEHYRMAVSMDGGNSEYAGNLARTLLRADEDPAEIAPLLQHVVLHDTRAEWVAWARDQLNTRGPLRTAAHTASPSTQLQVVEPLPTPKRVERQHLDDLPTPPVSAADF